MHVMIFNAEMEIISKLEQFQTEFLYLLITSEEMQKLLLFALGFYFL